MEILPKNAHAKAVKKEVGDEAEFEIAFDKQERIVPMHPKLQEALINNKDAKNIFEKPAPYLQLEIKRYFMNLKTEATVDKNN